MSSAQMMNEPATVVPGSQMIETKLEVINIPVADVDRAKRFYESLGWRLDADFSEANVRGVQMTPPGSPCSIHFGKGLTTAAPGSVQGLILAVADVEQARAALLRRGVEMSEVFHYSGIRGPRLAGPDPEHGSYRSWASFSDPDGNGWLLQEIRQRLPGRGLSNFDVATLSELLREAEKAHGQWEPTAPKHHWSSWYAAYIVARQQGKTAEQAVKEGARQLQQTVS